MRNSGSTELAKILEIEETSEQEKILEVFIFEIKTAASNRYVVRKAKSKMNF